MMEFNSYQTPAEEIRKMLPDECWDQFVDFMENVPLLRSLSSPSRKRACDLPRDEKGRIVVDLAEPHILEDMDYFRPSALHYRKHGCYTFLKPNANPNSEFGRWLRQERDRCWDGYVRESDGEWVTGFMYFYLNYCPIVVTKVVEGTSYADRVEDFPEVWEGIYLRFHYLEQARRGGKYNGFKGGNHACELARRGCSKSYSLASVMAHNFILGENRASCRRTMTVLTAYQKEYLSGKDGTLNKFVPMVDWCAARTQFPRRRLKDSPDKMIWQMGYKDVDTGVERGSLNTVIGVSSKDDEDKLRGKRGYVFFEEFGSFPKVLGIYNVVRYGVEEGDYVFGLIYLVGTSGNDENDFSGAKELLYEPDGYNIYSLPNVYDKDSQGRRRFAFFFPAYMNRKGCYNADGVSDATKALAQVLLARHAAKYKTTDPNTITRVIADMPVTPSEAILKTARNAFPVADLAQRIMQLDANPAELDSVWVGDIVEGASGFMEFVPSDGRPVRDFPTKDNKVEGCVEIFQMPEKSPETGRPYSNRYIAGIDPYDDDESETMSLGSIFVLDLWTDRIAAEYTGRPQTADDFYEKCRRLLLFFNARANYENNKKGLFAYFSMKHCLHLLTDTLEFLKDKQMVKDGIGNKSKGTNASLPVNLFGRRKLKEWFLKPVQVTVKDEEGRETEQVRSNLYLCRNRALLKEASLWNPDGNFDRVSAMGMLMLLREDRLILMGGDASSGREDQSSSYLGNDDFFTRNYDMRVKRKY